MDIVASHRCPSGTRFTAEVHCTLLVLLFSLRPNNFCRGLFQLVQLSEILHSLMREVHPSVSRLLSQLTEHPTDKLDSRSRLLRLSAPHFPRTCGCKTDELVPNVRASLFHLEHLSGICSPLVHKTPQTKPKVTLLGSTSCHEPTQHIAHRMPSFLPDAMAHPPETPLEQPHGHAIPSRKHSP